jgi:hypothetical protein
MLVVGVLKLVRPQFKVADDPTLKAFIDSGWLWQLIGVAEIAGGLALVSGWYVPLGLAVLTPVVAGILAFALKLGGEESGVGVLLALAHLGLLWSHRDAYRSLLVRHQVVSHIVVPRLPAWSVRADDRNPGRGSQRPPALGPP